MLVSCNMLMRSNAQKWHSATNWTVLALQPCPFMNLRTTLPATIHINTHSLQDVRLQAVALPLRNVYATDGATLLMHKRSAAPSRLSGRLTPERTHLLDTLHGTSNHGQTG